MATAQGAILRASVTADNDGLSAGDPCNILVDGSDTSCTANGLADYQPTAGDRLLVQRVGGQVEVMQFISRGSVPYVSSEALDAVSATADAAADTAASAGDAASAAQALAGQKTTNFVQDTTPTATGIGDTWTVPSQGNALYSWDGTQWAFQPLGAAALADDMLAGKVIPINEQVTLAWGVPDPSSDLSTATFTDVCEAFLPTRADGLTRLSLTPDGSNFTYLKMLSDTRVQAITVDASTGVESNLGSAITLGGANTYEFVWGITKLDNLYFLLTTTINTSTSAVKLLAKAWSTPGVGSPIVLTLDTDTVPGDPPWMVGPVGVANDGTHLLVSFVNATNHLSVRVYTTLGSLSTTVISTTTVTPGTPSLDLTYGTFDLGATRYVVSMGGVVSMNTSGVIQSSESWAAPPGGSMTGIEWDSTNSKFVANLSTNGLLHFTTATTDTSRYAAYSWADKNATGGTHETALSPTLAVTVKKRFNLSVTHFPVAPGAAATDTDAPSTTRLYFSSTNGIPSTFHLQADATYPAATLLGTVDLSSGTTALATSTFTTGNSGSLASETGGFVVNGDGTGAWPLLTKTIIPAGVIMPYGGSSAPTGFLLCDGSSVSRTTYATLFAIVGTTFGSADGSHFNLPDLRGKFPMGVSGSHALGASGGAETHALTTGELPSHTHGISIKWAVNKATGGTSTAIVDVNGTSGGSGSNTGDATSDATGSGTAHSILNPYLAVNYIIRTGN